MHSPLISRWVALVGVVLPVVALPVVGGLTAPVAIAQAPPACQPPNANEYLLLVVRDSQQTETRLQQALPPNATSTVCTYLQGVVVRVGGFTNAEVANTWAQYLTDMGGMQSFVVRPSSGVASPGTPASGFPTPATPVTPATPAAAPTPEPASDSTTPEPAPTASAPTATAPGAIAEGTAPPVTPTPVTAPPVTAPPVTPTPAATPAANRPFNPQPLGNGFAVVVNYFNRPEVAADVGQVLARNVGLVAYEQNPYLLAVYTADPAVAMSVLQTLSDRGFAASIIDSRKAVLLTPSVTAGN